MEIISNSQKQIQNLYNPLVQSVQAARQQHQGLQEAYEDRDLEARDKILSKKQQLDNMIEDFFIDQDNNQIQKKKVTKLKKKNKLKDQKIQGIRLSKF